MNREQAVEIIERHIDNNIASGSLVEQALSMAIDALKAQLSKEGTTKDAISRQAAIDALDKQIKQCCKALGSLCLSDVDKHAVEVKMASLRAYREMLENLPTVQPEVLACGNGELVAQPEPKEGYWIWVAGELMCSECRTIYSDLYPDYDNAVACPHCGAKMKGAKHEAN